MATRSKSSSESTASPTLGAMPSLDDLAKMAKQFKLPGVDVAALVEWQRKDMEALAEANRQAYEGIKTLAERRNQMLRESMAEWQQAAQGLTGADALAQSSAAVQRGMKKAMTDFRELATLEAKARTDAWKVLQQRMQDNMAQLQELMKGKK